MTRAMSPKGPLLLVAGNAYWVERIRAIWSCTGLVTLHLSWYNVAGICSSEAALNQYMFIY